MTLGYMKFWMRNFLQGQGGGFFGSGGVLKYIEQTKKTWQYSNRGKVSSKTTIESLSRALMRLRVRLKRNKSLAAEGAENTEKNKNH